MRPCNHSCKVCKSQRGRGQLPIPITASGGMMGIGAADCESADPVGGAVEHCNCADDGFVEEIVFGGVCGVSGLSGLSGLTGLFAEASGSCPLKAPCCAVESNCPLQIKKLR